VRVGLESVCENSVMTLPIKKRINDELFMDRTASLHIVETGTRVGTFEDDQLVDLADSLMEGSNIP